MLAISRNKTLNKDLATFRSLHQVSVDERLWPLAEHALEGHKMKWMPKTVEAAAKTRIRRMKEVLVTPKKDKLGKSR